MTEGAVATDLARLKRRTVAVLAAGIAAVLSLVVIFTDGGQEMAPSHPGDDAWTLAISLGIGVVSFVAMMRANPRNWKNVLLAMTWSAGIAFLCCPVTGITLMRLHEIADFHGGPIVESQRDIPIVSTSIHHGRGTSYGVWLKDYAALLTVDRSDYLGAFGAVEYIRPKGYCIHATLQTVGTASRIMALHGMALPTGSLGRCGSRGIDRNNRAPMSDVDRAAWIRALATPAPAAPAAPAPPSATSAPRS